MNETSNDRLDIACRRIRKLLIKFTIAPLRSIEQKIADAGPGPLRCDPHVITNALAMLKRDGVVKPFKDKADNTWYRLSSTSEPDITARMAVIEPLYTATIHGGFNARLGQALEIAVWRALTENPSLRTMGAFRDLDTHGDDKPYSKIEPPSQLGKKGLSSGRNLDFMITYENILAGIEVKNTRPWLYPDSSEVKEVIEKCLTLQIVPVLIARRIHQTCWIKLIPLGVILHQTYRQRYPLADSELAEKARHKETLGYHDILVGNEPDPRLLKFTQVHLPSALISAKRKFNEGQKELRDFIGK